METNEHFFQCPYCWESISIEIDPSEGEQRFIEDCQVCCHPIQFRCTFSEGELTSFDCERA